MAFVRLASRAEMPKPGEAKEFSVDGRTICVANVNGRLAAMDNVCIHRGGPLGQGTIERGKVVCPWHGWEFNPFTGEANHNSHQRMVVFVLRFEAEDIWIDLGSRQ